MTRKRRTLIPTELLLGAARSAADRLAHLSRDPQVRRDAAQVAQAVGQLLGSIRRASQSSPRR